MPLPLKPQFWLYFHTFFEESLDFSRLDSTNGTAWDPLALPHAVGAKSDVASTERSQVERSSPTCKATEVQHALGHQSLAGITP